MSEFRGRSAYIGEGKSLTTDGTSPRSSTPRRSRAEIRAAIAAMSDVERLQVTVVAKSFARRYKLPAEDLLQEAYVRALSTRTCAVDRSMVEFMAGTIRSVAWDGLQERLESAIS
jgi:DNA-directed RNA polymerase specialized sigma24 family protein